MAGGNDLRKRNNVRVSGQGQATMVFAHGFGCDQNMWRFVAPVFAARFRVVLFDLVGAGGSDLLAYDRVRHDDLQGYADDLLDLLDEFATGPVVFVGHSVSATIGVLADRARPGAIAAHVMIGPSPCYIDDGDYRGGFSREDIDSLLQTMDSNYLGWSSNMAPAIMGAPHEPALAEELTNSFCRTDPDIARQFARVTFLSDHRDTFSGLATDALVLQCSDDLIAPRTIGEFLQRVMPNARLQVIENIGHCPHLSEPDASVAAIESFLAGLDLPRHGH